MATLAAPNVEPETGTATHKEAKHKESEGEWHEPEGEVVQTWESRRTAHVRADSAATLPSPPEEVSDDADTDAETSTPPQLDFASSLNAVQLDALNRLKQLVRESGHSIAKHIRSEWENEDHYLLRFLRARHYVVDAAWAMLKADLEWREEEKIHEMLDKTGEEVLGCPVEVIQEQMPHWTQGWDKDGRPVMYRGFGHTLVAEWLKHTTLQKTLDYHLWYNEYLTSLLSIASARKGKTVDTFTFVVDAKGWYLGLATRVAYSYLKGMADKDAAHYPERLGKVIVINAPLLLNVSWKIISSWLDPVTKNKVFITGSEKEWRPILDEIIGKENLVDEYGGDIKSARPTDKDGKPYL